MMISNRYSTTARATNQFASQPSPRFRAYAPKLVVLIAVAGIPSMVICGVSATGALVYLPAAIAVPLPPLYCSASLMTEQSFVLVLSITAASIQLMPPAGT